MPCPLIQEIETRHTPESLIARLQAEPGTILLRSGTMEHGERFSLVAARPFLRFESYGSRCEIESPAGRRTLFGSPWKLLESLAGRYELLEEIDLPFPLGGCFGYFGYELKQFTEPHLPLTTHNDLELPECSVGFYDSLVVFDHKIDKAWLITTGRGEEGEVDKPPAPGGPMPTASDSRENDQPAHDSLRNSTPEGLAPRIGQTREECGGERGEEDG